MSPEFFEANFDCVLLDESDGIQTVSLKPHMPLLVLGKDAGDLWPNVATFDGKKVIEQKLNLELLTGVMVDLLLEKQNVLHHKN